MLVTRFSGDKCELGLGGAAGRVYIVGAIMDHYGLIRNPGLFSYHVPYQHNNAFRVV